MDDVQAARLFRWLDRGFWLIWLGFPVFVWSIVTEINGAPARLAEFAPDKAECIAGLPQLAVFSLVGQWVFWVQFAFEIAVLAVVLALSHSVIRRCATGRIFVAEMIGALRRIGLAIAIWPVADVVLTNLAGVVHAALGDLPRFVPYLTLDVTVMGVGLMMVTLAIAMRQAVRLREDADLTI